MRGCKPCLQAQLKEKIDIKIFILYLMDRMGYPLDYDTITSIIIQDDIVNYFDFAQCFGEVEDATFYTKVASGEAGNVIF